MNNVAGIDVSKGKSVVSVLRPFGEVVAKPFSVGHTGSELKELADYLKSLDGETSSLFWTRPIPVSTPSLTVLSVRTAARSGWILPRPFGTWTVYWL